MFILCWFLGAQISAKSYKMFEKLSQSGYLGTSFVASTNQIEESPLTPQETSSQPDAGFPIEQLEQGKVEESLETQKNPIIESTASHHHHNKRFPHNNNNHHHPNPSLKNYLNKKKSRSSSSSTSQSPIPLSVNTCPNCNARILENPKKSGGNQNSSKRVPKQSVAASKYPPSIWFLHPLSMDPQDSSSDLHRKRDADEEYDDDDLPRDSLEDTQVRGAGAGGGRQPGENYADDKDAEEDNGELSREDLIRFLLSNSSGGRQYQFLQHQLHQQHQHHHQQHYAGGTGGSHFHREVSASSSLCGAVGGIGSELEPIMDASFQDDFDDIHSDYQWFTESGFETDGVGCSEPALGVPEYPVSLLGDLGEVSHHHGNAEFDATMAQIDIEDFHSEDILLRLPPLCASDLQQGETIASITGSILQHLDFEDSMTGNSHSVDDDQNAQSMDMSICKSENLFSPMNENQEALPLSTFSTDSLDTRAGEILATCMTNRNNYTIAFQGMEESNTSSTFKTAPVDENSSSEIIENDPGMMTNWRQVTSNNSTGSQQRSIDNNNGSNESSTGGTPNNNSSNRTSWSNTTGTLSKHSLMTQSCPHPPRNNNMTMMTNNMGIFRTNPAAAIKLFDIQNVQTVQLAQIYQRHIANRQLQQLGSGSSMTDSGSMNNNNSNNNNNPMMTSGTGSSLSSGRHNTPQILEESWNNNRNPTMIPTNTPTHHHHPTHPHHHHHHHHHYSKYRSRKHSSTSTSSSSPTTTQLADAVRKLRSIEIQTSITLVTPPPSSKLYGNNETNEVCPNNASVQRSNSQGSYHHPQQQQQQHPGSQSSNAQSHHQHSQHQQKNQPPPVYICYPSYTLPDLRFLEQHRPKNPVILMPQRYKTASGRMAGVHRTQTSMACPGTGGYGTGGAPLHNVPKGRRPFSCNDIEELRCRDLSHVKDWPSLNFLLPKEYQAILAEIKPPEKREQRDDSEKETADIKEESYSQNYPNVKSSNGTRQSPLDNNAGGEHRDSAGDSGVSSGDVAAAAAAAGESPVILRRRMNGGNGRQNPTKRYSMNDAAGFLGQQVGITSNRNRNGLAEKFKRFSLQETLPEVAEITSEIAKNLEQLESLALTATSSSAGNTNTAATGQSLSSLCGGGENRNHQQHNQHHFEDIDESQQSTDNIPSFTGISSSEESMSADSNHHHHKRVPTNTPKQTSFVDFDNHFQLRNHAFFDDGGAAAAARIIAHVAPLCPNSGNKGSAHSQKAPIDMAQKQSLTDAVAAAVNQIQSVWETTQAMKNVATSGGSASGSGCGPSPSSADNKSRLTPTSDTAAMTPTTTGLAACLASPHKSLYQSIMSQTPAGKTVLESLCPALYSLLSDGLCPFLDTIFGRVPNTVWRVVEASIQYGPTAQSLNELVLRINSEELLAEGPMKFNAFVCGLLNLRNLGSWLTFLRTKERLLRTHYEPDAFMFLCNTTTRFLYDQMLVNMHLLSKTPFPAFQLDIFHETKLLHQSMNPVTPTKSLPASLPVSRKNSVKGSSRYNATGTGSTGGTPRKSTSADARPVKTQSKNSKYHANQLKKSQMKRSFSDERPKTTRVAPSTIPKSKTAQNITHERNPHHHYPASGLPGPTSTLNTRLLSRFPSRPKLSNYRGDHGAGGSHDDEGREKGMSEPTKAQRPKSFDGSHLTNVASGGGVTHNHKGLSPDSSKDTERFRRLQMQWELLSSDESRKGSSPGQSHTSSNTSNTTAPSLAGSKIPRPINSPTRANILGHLGNVRPSTASKR